MSYLQSILGGRGRAPWVGDAEPVLLGYEKQQGRIKNEDPAETDGLGGGSSPDRSQTAATKEIRARLVSSKGKRGQGRRRRKKYFIELHLHAGKNIALPIKQTILANHNSAECKKHS